ncbi:MAG: hypothetical protein R2849_06920 [Thermomicrobiales bacterium]
MSDDPQQFRTQTDISPEGEPSFLDSVLGRLIAVSMTALIVVGVVAIVIVLRGRGNASASEDPSARLLNRDFAVTGSEVLSIDPPLVSGACPADVHFTAEIRTTGGEGSLVYRWFFDDAGATEPEEISIQDGQTSVTVEMTKSMGGSDSKYRGLGEEVSIQVLEQDGESVPVASRKSSFTIACSS